MALERLDKIIASTGRFSRREVRSLIDRGRVTVSGVMPASASVKVDPDTADIKVDGEPVVYAKHVYYMLHKPAGFVCATEDGALPTVTELLPAPLRRRGLFPVGRLDKDTTGLLILTDDGDFAHSVISPKKHVAKVYEALLDAPADESDAQAFREGLVLGDGTRCLPAGLRAPDGTCLAEITVFEGKYHQVKRMFAARGRHVLALHRKSIGGLALDGSLLPGNGREMTEAEARKALRF